MQWLMITNRSNIESVATISDSGLHLILLHNNDKLPQQNDGYSSKLQL